MATATKTETVTLVLDKEEAEYLRDYLGDDNAASVAERLHGVLRAALAPF